MPPDLLYYFMIQNLFCTCSEAVNFAVVVFLLIEGVTTRYAVYVHRSITLVRVTRKNGLKMCIHGLR